MSSNVFATAVRQALRNNEHVSYAYAQGPTVVLVLNARPLPVGDPRKLEGRGDLHVFRASSAAMAKRIARRAIVDLDTWGFAPSRSLEVSALYAEAEWRFACRRKGVRA